MPTTTAFKTARTLVPANTSNAASNMTEGTSWNLSTALGGMMTARVDNGSTGPTVGCDFIVHVSLDGASWKEFSRQTAGNANDGSYPFAVEIPPGVLYARPTFTGNTGQAVTVEAFGHELTSLSHA